MRTPAALLSTAILAPSLALGALVGPAASPAQAGTECRHLKLCGYLSHASPDAGYNPPILVTCAWGNNNPGAALREVPVGRDSGCVDVDGVFVRAGEQVRCLHVNTSRGYEMRSWDIEWDATGWHKLDVTKRTKAGRGCVLEKD